MRTEYHDCEHPRKARRLGENVILILLPLQIQNLSILKDVYGKPITQNIRPLQKIHERKVLKQS